MESNEMPIERMYIVLDDGAESQENVGARRRCLPSRMRGVVVFHLRWG